MTEMKDLLLNVFVGLSKPRVPSQGEYLNEADGLIYCACCHTPRQAKIQLKGYDQMVFPPVMCRCRREEAQRAEEERVQSQFEIETKRMKAEGLQDRAIFSYRFENDNGLNPQMETAKRYVQNFETMEKKGMGLLLCGSVGTGKTFMAGCIANALLEKRIPVLMTKFSRILNQLTCQIGEDKNRLLESFDNYRLLIIDDLGAERNSEFALEQVFSVIDARVQSGRPMIVTTNMTLSMLQNPADIAHARIYDRILAHCIPVKVNDVRIRQKNAEKEVQSLRKMLE